MQDETYTSLLKKAKRLNEELDKVNKSIALIEAELRPFALPEIQRTINRVNQIRHTSK